MAIGSIIMARQPGQDGSGDLLSIMPEPLFVGIQKQRRDLAPPLFKSAGTGPEGDARLVLVRGGEV